MFKAQLFDVPGGMCLYAPFGTIERYSTFKEVLKAPPDNPDELPVLFGRFQSNRFRTSRAIQTAVRWGVVSSHSGPLLAFAMQSAKDAVYWLANPYDAQLWRMLEAWDSAGMMALAAGFEDDTCTFVMGAFSLDEYALQLKPTAFDSAECEKGTFEFMKDVAMLLTTDRVAHLVSEQMPPSAQRVQACTVATKTTGRIPVHHSIAPFVKCRLVAVPWEQSHRAVPGLGSLD